METQTNNPNPNPNGNSITGSWPVWPTVDGSLGLSEDESVKYARRFYRFGFAMLPWLWAVNCFYFWPVLRHSRSFPRIRPCTLSLSLSLSLSALSIFQCCWFFRLIDFRYWLNRIFKLKVSLFVYVMLCVYRGMNFSFW